MVFGIHYSIFIVLPGRVKFVDIVIFFFFTKWNVRTYKTGPGGTTCLDRNGNVKTE